MNTAVRHAIVFTLTAGLCAGALHCSAQDVRPASEFALPSGAWSRPVMLSHSKVLILRRPVGQRNVSDEAVLGDIRSMRNELNVIARHKDVETAVAIDSVDSVSYVTVSGGEAALWDGDGTHLKNWKLTPEFFTPDAAVWPHSETIALRSINRESSRVSLWRIDMKRDSVTQFATHSEMHMLERPPTEEPVFVSVNDGNGSIIQTYDRNGTAGKSIAIPKGFLASSATANGLQIWGRTIREDRKSTQIAFLEIRDPMAVIAVSANNWHAVEPRVSASGKVAFCRIVTRDGAQHLCLISNGQVRTIHERLVPGGGRFNWSDSGTELISIVSDEDGHERVRIDPIGAASL